MFSKFTLASASSIALAAICLSPAMHPAQPAIPGGPVLLDEATIRWEYNATDQDLGVQVFVDGEEWKALRIRSPQNQTLLDIHARGPLQLLGLTELFFEGGEPELSSTPLPQLLANFPEGQYKFAGRTVDGEPLLGLADFSHAIPDGPALLPVQTGPNNLVHIRWEEVTAPPPGFPNLPIVITGYQVLVGESFEVTLPASARSLTLPPEFVASLSGEQEYEVLAIEAGGNQSISEGSFTY